MFLLQTIFLAVLTATVAQPPPPTQGVQLSVSYDIDDILFPLTVSQCEPVLIYYNNTRSGTYFFPLATPDLATFLTIIIPQGFGYIEWFCNIPAGHGFIASWNYHHYVVVQTSSSSSCLRNITTTYVSATYDTTLFQSYTARPPNTTTPSFTSGFLATYAHYPNLAVIP